MSSREHILVVNIEIGITKSGYGWSFFHEYERNPFEVSSCNWYNNWHDNYDSPILTPTILLLDERKNFVAFGNDAVKEYEDLLERGEHEKYSYLDLRLMPNRSKLTLQSTLTDATGKYISIKDVFTHGIAYMTRHVMSTINNQRAIVPKEDVKWVFIAPFGREDDRKFMRDAAVQAGIARDDCVTATRQEAMMFYLMYYLRKKNVGDEAKYFPEKRYIIVDAREYVEITVMEIQGNGKMKQLTNIRAELCGQMEICNSFEKMLEEIFGENILKECKEEHPIDFKEMPDELYLKVVRQNLNITEKMGIKIPCIINKFFKSKFEDCSINDVIANSDYRDTCTFMHGKIRLSFSIIKSFVDEFSRKVTELIRKCLELEHTREVHTILMTGQLSRMRTFQEYAKHQFPEMCVMPGFQHEDVSHIIGGAVFGHTNGILPQSDFKLDVSIETYAEIDFVRK